MRPEQHPLAGARTFQSAAVSSFSGAAQTRRTLDRSHVAADWKVRAPRFRIAAFLFLLLHLSLPARADLPTQREYELKAAVLYHIIEYVEWPSDALTNQAGTLQLGLIGDIPFADAIEVLNGKTVQGRRLLVKRVSLPEDAARCQVLFIGASEKPRLSKIVNDVRNHPILTVSEVEGFAERGGGMVNLVAGPNRIIMEINRQTAGQAKLSLSSQLLRLAKVYPK